MEIQLWKDILNPYELAVEELLVKFNHLIKEYQDRGMAVGEMFCQDETMPIILDDAFVMYDDKRLKQTLKWLYHSGRQVILFTCHGREQRILDEIKQEN